MNTIEACPVALPTKFSIFFCKLSYFVQLSSTELALFSINISLYAPSQSNRKVNYVQLNSEPLSIGYLS